MREQRETSRVAYLLYGEFPHRLVECAVSIEQSSSARSCMLSIVARRASHGQKRSALHRTCWLHTDYIKYCECLWECGNGMNVLIFKCALLLLASPSAYSAPLHITIYTTQVSHLPQQYSTYTSRLHHFDRTAYVL